MSQKSQQIFVRTGDPKRVELAVRRYVDIFSNRFMSCSRYHLHGVEQVLKALIRKKRHFWLLGQGDWTAIWEVVESTSFADPSVAKFLASELQTQAIWAKLDVDYNIWAYQIYESDSISEETYLPESYFLGDEESPSRYDYGSCLDAAGDFNSSRSLPEFLTSLSDLDENSRRAEELVKIVCKLPHTVA